MVLSKTEIVVQLAISMSDGDLLSVFETPERLKTMHKFAWWHINSISKVLKDAQYNDGSFFLLRPDEE